MKKLIGFGGLAAILVVGIQGFHRYQQSTLLSAQEKQSLRDAAASDPNQNNGQIYIPVQTLDQEPATVEGRTKEAHWMVEEMKAMQKKQADLDSLLKALKEKVIYDKSISDEDKRQVVLKMLSKVKDYPNARRDLAYPLLWEVVQSGSPDKDMVQLLISEGGLNDGPSQAAAPINYIRPNKFFQEQDPFYRDDGNVSTTLLISAIRNAPAVVETMLKLGADPNTPDYYMGKPMRTPLMWAAIMRKPELVTTLLHWHANIDSQDQKGHTAAEYSGIHIPNLLDFGIVEFSEPQEAECTKSARGFCRARDAWFGTLSYFKEKPEICKEVEKLPNDKKVIQILPHCLPY